MIARKPIPIARLRELFTYDQGTGLFIRRVASANCTKVGEVAGTVNADGYVVVRVDGVSYLAHRLAWAYVTGVQPGPDVDHEDGNGENNRFSNLRNGSHKFNMGNQREARSNNSTGVLGVSQCKASGRYKARIVVDGRLKHLGYHDDVESAHRAYVDAKRVLHAGNTL